MTATDEQHERLGKGYPYTLRPELHKALRARGIDYWVAQGLTFWNCPDGRECVAYGYQSNGKPRLAVKIAGITDPEQAIEATLGRGTGHNVVLAEMEEKISKKYSMAMSALRFGGFMPEDEPAEFECSACGETAKVDWETLYQMDYCPFCGARIVEVDE